MALTDKTIAGTYKDLLDLDNSNNGVSSTGTTVKDGLGNETMLQLGQTRTKFVPTSNSESNFIIEDSASARFFCADGTNKQIKVGTTQSIANTQYLSFKCIELNVSAGTHLAIPLAGYGPGSPGGMPTAAWTLGTAANPVAPAFSNNADDILQCVQYIDTNITVDSVNVLTTGDSASGDTINFHLLNLTTADTTTITSWSATTVVADCTDVTTAGREQFYRIALDIQSANVDAGQYLALTIESSGTNSDYSVNALVKYHLR